MHWLTVEVFDAELPATAWLRAWHDALVETALSSGAVYWEDHVHAWGIVPRLAPAAGAVAVPEPEPVVCVGVVGDYIPPMDPLTTAG